MTTVTMKIGGMTCMGCVGSVKRVLENTAGVSSVEVSLERSEAVVGFDPQRSSPQVLAKAVADAGYDVLA